jgi:hypothetical protein
VNFLFFKLFFNFDDFFQKFIEFATKLSKKLQWCKILHQNKKLVAMHKMKYGNAYILVTMIH